ncbi:MAG: flagellar basal body L-ring protein FlgH [Bdellovibrionota bacterium]
MIKNSISTFILLLFVATVTSGCSTLRNFIRGKEDGVKSVTTPRFSDQENLRSPASVDKQYRRMNRERFEEEADVRPEAGSLWVMEGQGAYLFAQNQMRMVGDLLNVKIEGGAKSQLQTKTKVISKLLERLEGSRGLASTSSAPAQGQANAQNKEAGAKDQAQGEKPADPSAQGADGAQQGTKQATLNPGEVPFAVQSVPTRIVEQLKDGSYRVRGMQPFMIGKREYKVIVTGVVRPEDFDDSGMDSTKLLDPQFDIVSSRKGASL